MAVTSACAVDIALRLLACTTSCVIALPPPEIRSRTVVNGANTMLS
jgi:hypothetical protein